MSESWHAFLFGSFDAGGVMTVDKPPLALWVQALSARAFGFSSLEHARAAGADGRRRRSALVYDLTRRRFGRAAGLRGGPRARADADHRRDLAPQQPRRAARALLHRARCGPSCAGSRTAARAGSCWPGVCVGLGLRGEDGAPRCSSCPASPRPGCGSRRAGRVAAAASARGRRRRDGRRRAGLAGARVADPGRRPPVDLRHRRQLDLVADPRLQRPRPAGRAERRAGRRRGRRGRARRRAGRPVRRRPGPAAAAQRAPSAARRAGCSASRWSPASRLVASRGCAAPTPARAG